MEEINNYFIELNSIDVSDYVETKGGAVKLNYLSWAYAWGEIKRDIRRRTTPCMKTTTVGTILPTVARRGSKRALQSMGLNISNTCP